MWCTSSTRTRSILAARSLQSHMTHEPKRGYPLFNDLPSAALRFFVWVVLRSKLLDTPRPWPWHGVSSLQSEAERIPFRFPERFHHHLRPVIGHLFGSRSTRSSLSTSKFELFCSEPKTLLLVACSLRQGASQEHFLKVLRQLKATESLGLFAHESVFTLSGGSS